MAHTVCAGPQQGQALDASRKLALSCGVFCRMFLQRVAKTVEIRKTFHSLIVTTTKR